MNKRLVWLAPIALLVLLSGCRVTFTTTAYAAPSSLVGYSLALSNSARSGRAAEHETYHFKSASEASDASRAQAQSWSYHRDNHDTATVSLTFTPHDVDALVITCVLTFRKSNDGNDGEHECKYEARTSTIFGDIVEKSLSKGTFRIF